MKSTVLFAVIVACLAGFTLYDYVSGQKRETAQLEASKVVRLKKSEITEIEIKGQVTAFRLERKNDHWSIIAPFQESADQQQVFSFLDQLTSEKSLVAVSEKAGDLERYGLKEPRFTLILKTPTEAEQVRVGTMKAYDGSLYAQIDEASKVWLVSSAWDVLLTKPIKDFRDTKVYRRSMPGAFDSIRVSGRDTRFEFTHEKAGYELKGSIEPVYQPSVETWLEHIKALRGAAFLDQIKKDFVSDYTVTLTRKGEAPFELKVARDPELKQSVVTSTDLPGGFSSQVLASESALASVIVRPDVFYNKRAPFEFPLSEVTHLRFHDSRTGKDLDTSQNPAKPDALIRQLHELDAVRFLGAPNAFTKSKFRNPSKITLSKADGTKIFEMSWGEVFTEPATLDRPEARFLPVMTSLTKQVVGVPEKSLLDLARQPEDGESAGANPGPFPKGNQ